MARAPDALTAPTIGGDITIEGLDTGGSRSHRVSIRFCRRPPAPCSWDPTTSSLSVRRYVTIGNAFGPATPAASQLPASAPGVVEATR